jgi:hypothetical protein
MSAANDNSKIILAGALLVGAYLYSRRNMAAYPAQSKNPYATSSMPGSAGVGWQQVGVSALTGFLKGLASGVSNGANSYNPSLSNPQQMLTDYNQSGTVQDVYDPLADGTAYWA